MSDPAAPVIATPVLDALGATAQPPASAPAPAAAQPPAAPVAAPPAPPAAPALNPWALRPARPAPAAAPVVETPAAAAPPVAPVVVDPRVADLEQRVASLSSVLTRQAAAELAGVPENVRAYVSQIAGTDAAKQLDALHAMRAAGLVAATPATVPTGASTMPAASLPSPAAIPSPDAAALATYEDLKAKAPLRASVFRSENAAVIERAIAARASRPS